MITKQQYKLYTSLADDLNKSFPTLRRWYDDNSYPADICIKIARLTGNSITCVELRPDIFKPTLTQIKLHNSTIDNLNELLEHNQEMLIALLNSSEIETPYLYAEVTNALLSTSLGSELITQRTAHRQNVSN